jgi:hypothetical protein
LLKIFVISCWQYSIQNSHVHSGGDASLQIISNLDVILDVLFFQVASHHSFTVLQTVHGMHIG